MGSMIDQDGADHSMTQGWSAERRIIPRPDEHITVELSEPEVIRLRLAPRLQRRRDVEWLGIIRDAKGKSGGLGRLRANGKLVEVFGRSISILRAQVAAAFSAALDEEIRSMMKRLPASAEEDSRHS
jgi:hypothetical protein